MGIFNNNNKDSKRAAENRAYNDNQPGQGIMNNDSNRVNEPNYNNSINDDRYADNNSGRGSTMAQNNPPDQRSGAMNLGGHQYQDPYAEHPGQHPGHLGHGTNNVDAGTNVTNTRTGGDLTNTQAAGAGEPGYSNTGVQAGVAGQDYPAGQGGQNYNHPGAGTAAGLGAAGAGTGYAAGHAGMGNTTAAGNPDYYNPTEAQLKINAGQVPTKSDILKHEYMGKLENAAGVLLSSEGMKARGAQKEMEALAMKRQANELGNAQRLGQHAHGAHPHHAGLGAAGQPGTGTVGAGPMQQPGATSGMPGNNMQGGMTGRY
ncbi:hypothetical protein BOTBODRAFT_44952 [Botryobasidium botryosum FD-172 SS1]|uniref:Uncharacterized protein n=1 Tax=Botryobasidium botryosum (strain FD-172 SS1) TaxID=930990 RepID=A0A067ME61_BOTB1|nr:hypothetical protein BOTBODRAFT_44952 [Botryobasidium botryosum FD-172 SS1]